MKQEDLFMSDKQIRKSTFDLEPAFNDGRIEPIEMDRAISQASALYAVEKVLECIVFRKATYGTQGNFIGILSWDSSEWQVFKNTLKENKDE